MQEIRLLAAVQIFAAMLKDVFGGKIKLEFYINLRNAK